MSSAPSHRYAITDNTLCCGPQQHQVFRAPRPLSQVPQLAHHTPRVEQVLSVLLHLGKQVHHYHWQLLTVHAVEHMRVLITEPDQFGLMLLCAEGQGVPLVPRVESDHQPCQGVAGIKAVQEVRSKVQMSAKIVWCNYVSMYGSVFWPTS